MSTVLTFEQTIQAPIEQVYRAFTNATALREWLCDTATVDARPGGRIYLAWISNYYAAGVYTQLELNALVAFTWAGRDDPAPTQVEVRMTASSPSATLLTLYHSGLGNDPAWLPARKQINQGWTKGLKNLSSVLEEGPDLRITLRPMLGFILGEITPKIANELSLPVCEGMRLDSLVAGMGADRAGLQKDDLIVSLDGKPITQFADLPGILAARQGGDWIEVEFYRGPKKHQVSLELSRRPIPNIPSTPQEMAETLSNVYAELDRILGDILKGITPAQQDFRPDPGEWNIKEILAHLIHNEREAQSWVNDLVYSQERLADGYADNLPARLLATVKAYPSTDELFAEFKRTEAETIQLIAGLPANFVARKGSYWKLGFSFLQPPFHVLGHIDQIRANIQMFKPA